MNKSKLLLLLLVFATIGCYARPWVDAWIPDHFGLTRDAEFADNALYLLLEDPTKSSPSILMPDGTFVGG